MSVAQHLKIKLSEYDERIRTFIENYDELLDEVAALMALVKKPQPTIIDFGIGTGALAARCLRVAPHARLIGIDADADMLTLARRRLAKKRGAQLELRHSDFLTIALPRCDAIVTTLALHHIHDAGAKQQFYAKCYAALRRGGILANGDCCIAENPQLSQRYMKIWDKHMLQFYTPRQVKAFAAAWAGEDKYFPLRQEIAMLSAAGFEVEVTWRRAPQAVLVGKKM